MTGKLRISFRIQDSSDKANSRECGQMCQGHSEGVTAVTTNNASNYRKADSLHVAGYRPCKERCSFFMLEYRWASRRATAKKMDGPMYSHFMNDSKTHTHYS